MKEVEICRAWRARRKCNEREIVVGKLEGREQLGRPRWGNDIEKGVEKKTCVFRLHSVA